MPIITVDVDFQEFDNQELIEELEGRGYSVIPDDYEVDVVYETPFTHEELDFLRKIFDDMKYSVGSMEWGIREKLSDL